MNLVHLIYSSASTDKDLSEVELTTILNQSRENNEKKDISGILLYEDGSFFQVLEGERHLVDALYEKICKDKRHQNVTKIIEEEIEEKSFGDWSMGYPRLSRKELQELPGLNDFFQQGQSFRELGEGRARKLLEAFKKGQWHK